MMPMSREHMQKIVDGLTRGNGIATHHDLLWALRSAMHYMDDVEVIRKRLSRAETCIERMKSAAQEAVR